MYTGVPALLDRQRHAVLVPEPVLVRVALGKHRVLVRPATPGPVRFLELRSRLKTPLAPEPPGPA